MDVKKDKRRSCRIWTYHSSTVTIIPYVDWRNQKRNPANPDLMHPLFRGCACRAAASSGAPGERIAQNHFLGFFGLSRRDGCDIMGPLETHQLDQYSKGVIMPEYAIYALKYAGPFNRLSGFLVWLSDWEKREGKNYRNRG